MQTQTVIDERGENRQTSHIICYCLTFISCYTHETYVLRDATIFLVKSQRSDKHNSALVGAPQTGEENSSLSAIVTYI